MSELPKDNWDSWNLDTTSGETNNMTKTEIKNISGVINESSVIKVFPIAFQEIFKNANPVAQKKLFDHVNVYDDHLEFKITLDWQETIVPIARKNLLIDKVVPESLETHNGISYGKLSDNYIPEGFKITKEMLEQMANIMPALDYCRRENKYCMIST